jgi:hypothetical protein
VSPGAKLCGFLILLAVIFGAAHLAGSWLGPVTTHQAPATHPAPPGHPGMNMGAPAPRGIHP